MKLDIRKHLDLSTCHITLADNGLLAECGDQGLTGWMDRGGPAPIVVAYEEGFFVWVPDGDKKERREYMDSYRKHGFSEALVKLLKLSRKNGCDQLRLDRDGDVVEGLERFNW